MFVDRAVVEVRAGDGGAGAVAFRREKYVPLGGPSGGDGGRGGSVRLVGTPALATLISLQHRTQIAAAAGAAGQSKNRHGASAPDLDVPMPLGTEVFDADGGQRLGEVIVPERPLLVARGGAGGRGNARFATSTRQAPRFAERGESGQRLRLRLELRVLADVGLAGMPNAGKSTLLGAVSAARPKVAPYAFTTLVPQLGVVRRGERELVMADIPGLIEGAHEGRGLGSEFLRHISRCRLLVLVVDAAGSEGRDPLADLEAVERELRLYSPELAERPRVLAANKRDVAGWEEHWPRLRDWPGAAAAFPICAAAREGTDAMIEYLLARLAEMPPRHVEGGPEEAPVVRPDFGRSLDVRRDEAGVFVVRGEALERLVRQADLENPEALDYLFERMVRLGLPGRLRRAGAEAGDTAAVGGWSFPLGSGGAPLLGADGPDGLDGLEGAEAAEGAEGAERPDGAGRRRGAGRGAGPG